jgi:hypothetical protein
MFKSITTFVDEATQFKVTPALKQLKQRHPIVHRIITLPYNLCMNFLGCMDGYEAEHKEKHKTNPEWYMYALFAVWSVGYMCKSLKTLLVQYTKSNMRHPVEHVRHVNNSLLEVDYVYKSKPFALRIPVSTRFTYQFVSASNTNEHGQTCDVSFAVNKFLGPSEDWNHQPYTPAVLGFHTLTISKLDAESLECVQRTFQAHDQLVALKAM